MNKLSQFVSGLCLEVKNVFIKSWSELWVFDYDSNEIAVTLSALGRETIYLNGNVVSQYNYRFFKHKPSHEIKIGSQTLQVKIVGLFTETVSLYQGEKLIDIFEPSKVRKVAFYIVLFFFLIGIHAGWLSFNLLIKYFSGA